MIYPSDDPAGAGERLLSATVLAALVAVLPLPGVSGAATAQEEGAPGTEHRVRPGETLWDLAARYLDDPFAWEELYRLNRERVSDPDRIFPGQVLVMPSAGVAPTGRADSTTPAGEAAPAAAAAGVEPGGRAAPEEEGRQANPFEGPTVFDEGGAGGAVTTSLSVEAADPPPLVSPSDVYGAAWIGPRRLEPVGSVARVLRGRAMDLELPPTVRVRDRVVLALGGSRVEVGTRLQAVRAGRRLEEAGRVYHPVGLVEVTEVVGDSARARVGALYGRFEVGAPVVAAPSLPDPSAMRTAPAEDSLATRVLAVEREGHLVGGESVVFLEVGAVGEIRPGDEFALYGSGPAAPAARRPEDRLAVVRVVRVTPEGATARVVELRDVGAQPGSPAVRIRRPAQ